MRSIGSLFSNVHEIGGSRLGVFHSVSVWCHRSGTESLLIRKENRKGLASSLTLTHEQTSTPAKTFKLIFLEMYSTKTIHKNIGQTYTSIGDPYKTSVEALPQRWKEKQFVTQTHPLRNGYFSRLHYHNEEYTEIAEQYRKTQPLDKRKLGFGSHDAFKSGEFTSSKATERYRDCVRKETKLLDRHRRENGETKSIEQAKAKAPTRKPPKDKFGENLTEPKFLYDIGRTNITPYTPEYSHDSFYKVPKHAPVVKGADSVRRLGSHRTMSSMIGEKAWGHKFDKAEFGIVNYVEKFYDKGHLESCNY